MFKSARTILPVLMLVCLFSFIIRGLEVWSGVKSMAGFALAVEASQESNHKPPKEENAGHMETEVTAAKSDTENHDADGTQEDEALGDPPSAIDEYEDYEITPIQAELAEDLVAQRKRLDVREAELVQKQALLQAAEQELDRKYEELLTLRQEIEELLNRQSEEEDQQINSLVKIYENMKPKQAAEIFNTLDLDILVEVISRMSERKVSPVLAAMNPERARTVTIMLAEQKQLPKLPVD